MHYDSGAVMVKLQFRNGLETHVTWYTPDGSVVAASAFDKRRLNTGYDLRQDGSIRTILQYKYDPAEHAYFAHGIGIVYAPVGTIEALRRYEDGVVVSETKTSISN